MIRKLTDERVPVKLATGGNNAPPVDSIYVS
jgi:hypothetical protein